MFSMSRGVSIRDAASEVNGFLNEKVFANVLRLERRRSERSGYVFLLVLLHLGDVHPRERKELLRLLASAIRPVVRDTDLIGFYEQDSIVGLIFTHVQGQSRIEAKDAVSCKLNQALAASSLSRRTRITYHFFPEHDTTGAQGSVAEIDKSVDRARPSARMLKRSIDIAGSLFFLAVFSPLFPVIALWIKMDSRGPVFFRQKRLGQYAKAFGFLKFRSMYVDNDPAIHQDYVAQLIAGQHVVSSGAGSGRVFKITNDPRITRAGRILRKTSLDELPQFINVLKGEMSLVGPRPPVPYEFERYALWHRRRIAEVKPGLSGLWQVNGRSKTTFDEMVRLDLQYARTWSLWLDFKILLRTPAAVISGDGAY